MAITLPLPVRVAAGILATGIDRVRSLPEDIPALPVTLVGNAMRLSMRVQQEIAALATRGDELLGGVIAAPQENPSWARFDDDEPALTPLRAPRATKTPSPRPKPVTDSATAGDRVKPGPAERGGTAGVSSAPVAGALGATGTAGRSSSAAQPSSAAAAAPAEAAKPPTEAPSTEAARSSTGGAAAVVNGAAYKLSTPTASALPPESTIATAAAVEVPAAIVEQALVAAGDGADPLAGEPDPAVETPPAGTGAGANGAAVNGAGEDAAREHGDPEHSSPGLPSPEHGAAELTARQQAAQGDGAAEPTEVLEGLSSAVTADPSGASGEGERPAGPALAGGDGSAAGGDSGPTALPGYDRMTLAQVRGHLRELSAADVTALLGHERDSENRPPFLTLLSNRLVTLDAQNS
ncbi:MAG TPA: hypothetical protein VII33_03370 [Nakamurella sp.]